MATSGPLLRFHDRQTGANDLSISVAKLAGRVVFVQLEYERDAGTVDAITLLLIKLSRGRRTVIREVIGFINRQFLFAEQLQLEAGDTVTFTTSGAGASEDHSALLLLEQA